MNSSLLQRNRRHENARGAALVIILAFLVLLTGIVAVFLSRALIETKSSSSSANQTRANLLARSAVDMITGDLKQEIVNGSTSTNVGPSTNQTTLYFPLSVTNMVPMRIGNATNSAGVDFAPNLIRRSIRSDTLPVPSRASAVNSATDASSSGRSVSLARWNSHYLIPRLNAGSSTIDCTPTNYFTAPDWVMVTTSGPKVLTTPDQTTIGRYAYAIYDEGGLLDANVAGYPSSIVLSAPSTQTIDGTVVTINGKGSLALADLTAIGMTQSDVNNLVGWRNYATVQPTGSLSGSFTYSSPTGTNYYSYITSTTNAFLTVNPTSYNSRTDQAFTTRQALLKFQRATGFSQDALQYLGTFSRDVEQPSFFPDTNRPSGTYTYAYGGNDALGKENSINPSLLTVRDSGGQPIVKRRFPLSRLALMSQANATLRNGGTLTATQTTQIHNYFGLVWDSTNSQWDYVSPDGVTTVTGSTTPASQIKTLAQVAAVSPVREPDFFETLYAAISCDSLGKQLGYADGQNASSAASGYSPHYYANNGAAIDSSIEFQIIQVGVNLMDQYDSSSYPTTIAYYDSATTTTRQFYGVKNLPYLDGWMQSWYRMKPLVPGTDFSTTSSGTIVPPTSSTIGAGSVYESWVMIQPLLWNPHAPNTSLNTSSTYMPTNFRVLAGYGVSPPSPGTLNSISMYPLVRPSWWALGWQAPTSLPAISGHAPPVPNGLVDGSTSYIQFNATPNTTATPVAGSFPEPCRLLYNFPSGCNTATGTNANTSYTANGALTSGAFSLDHYGSVIDTTLATYDAPSDGKTIIGFFAGQTWTGPYSYAPPTADCNTAAGEVASNGALVTGNESNSLEFRLQYQAPNKTWLTYDVINQVQTYSGPNCVVDSQDVLPYLRSYGTGIRIDPRTDRWGLVSMNTYPLAVNPTAGGLTAAGTSPVENSINGAAKPYNFTTSAYAHYTLDPGGGVGKGVIYRPGLNAANNLPGWTGFGDISDIMVNSTVSTTISGSTPPGNRDYYTDADGIVRRASGANFSGTDGLPLVTGNYTSRPVVLNRPFQSVAEMGYAFSGTPWKDINFFTPESGDSALLDAFCLNELPVTSTPASLADVTVAGRVNLNTRQPKVLQALIQGVSKAEGGVITTTESAAAANALVTWTTDTTSNNGATTPVLTKGPLRNRSELVGKFVSQVNSSSPSLALPTLSSALGYSPTTAPNIDGSKSFSGYSSMLTSTGTTSVFAAAASQPDTHDAAAIKRRRECILRALVDSGNARTWNLMIDVVAQTGRYPSTATAAADLSKFIVTGETRYWVHVAIDRYTGTIIAESVEPVND